MVGITDPGRPAVTMHLFHVRTSSRLHVARSDRRGLVAVCRRTLRPATDPPFAADDVPGGPPICPVCWRGRWRATQLERLQLCWQDVQPGDFLKDGTLVQDVRSAAGRVRPMLLDSWEEWRYGDVWLTVYRPVEES